jgi:hypothetical protein
MKASFRTGGAKRRWESHRETCRLGRYHHCVERWRPRTNGCPSDGEPPGTTQGPWTSVKPGNSGSYCSPGEYAVGIEVEVAPSGTGPCVECISRLRVICRRYGI